MEQLVARSYDTNPTPHPEAFCFQMWDSNRLGFTLLDYTYHRVPAIQGTQGRVCAQFEGEISVVGTLIYGFDLHQSMPAVVEAGFSGGEYLIQKEPSHSVIEELTEVILPQWTVRRINGLTLPEWQKRVGNPEFCIGPDVKMALSVPLTRSLERELHGFEVPIFGRFYERRPLAVAS